MGVHTHRFVKDEPAVRILVHDRNGMSALWRLDQLPLCFSR
jgi:hypothetical protein